MSKGDGSENIPKIIAHMNTEHSHNLEDYLVVFGNVDEDFASQQPTLETLELDGFTVSFIDDTGKKTSIRFPIEPTMNHFNETRGHFVDLAQKAAKRRGFSEYMVNEVPLPLGSTEIVLMLLFVVLWFFSAYPDYLHYVVNNASTLSEGTKELIIKYTTSAFKVLLGIHSLESILILYPMMRKYRMGIFNKMLSLSICLAIGIFHIKAYKKLVDNASNKPRKTK